MTAAAYLSRWPGFGQLSEWLRHCPQWVTGYSVPLSRRPPRLQTMDLSVNFTLLLVLCGLLGTDWLLRLFKGLL